MKLSTLLGRVLTDVKLRQAHPQAGVCALVDVLAEEWKEANPGHPALDSYGNFNSYYSDFSDARRACSQTDSPVYPVVGPRGPTPNGRCEDYHEACKNGTIWRGEYGVNRRKLVRDCWRWAKERGL